AVIGDGSEAPESPARWAVIDGLATLADRSLVTVSADDPPRYRLLDTMRAFARQAMAETDGEFEAVRRQHARALTAWFMRYTPSDVATQLYMADIENAREAIGWARVHDLHQAALLTARAARISTFYVWRNECTQWLRALQPAMVSSAGQALPAEVQATWWTEMARTATFLGDPQARTAARRALALWQPLQQPMQALFAAVVWVRSIEQAGDELDEACAALQAQAAATPPPTARERFWLLGALTKAALVRGDDAAVLEGRLAEVTLGQELGSDDLVETAESNVVNTLNALQRHAEAAERGRVLLSRIDRRNRDENANLPWVLAGLLEALTDIGRLDEARALVPRACAVSRRFNALAPLPSMPWLAASQGRFEAAARLVGHVRQRFEARGATPDRGENGLLERAWQAAEQALGAAQVDGLLRLGRALDEDAAAALAAG
ncbi:hypothetical protein, partial [Aquabacterium sp.]|uniref:hypothetical protein n=1 Tax=Aquabacterium sp. TaxID=1872578 RepID=UPI002CB9AB2B